MARDDRLDRRLDRLIDATDLAVDREDLAVDRATLRLLILIGREIRQMEDTLVANLDTINAALEGLASQISQLGEQVAALQADSVTQEQLDQVAAGITAAGESVDAIITSDDEATEEPDPNAPVVDNTLPNPDDQPHVEHH